MKVPVKTPETWMSGVKLGIVRLGRAAGKMKYTLLDEPDISLVQEYTFEAKVVVDKDGNGARIYAYAYEMSKGRISGQFVHEMLWERRYGGVAPGFRVIHKNGITMDNRVENLCLVPENFKGPLPIDAQAKQREQSLYWAAMQELPAEHVIEENLSESGKMKSIYYSEMPEEDDATYYECHYLPCTNMEKEPREFSICGRCQEARYCGPSCQQRDWPIHKTLCREKPRLVFPERYPDR